MSSLNAEHRLAVDLARDVPMLNAPHGGPAAWRRGEIAPADWLVPLGDGALRELDQIARTLAYYSGTFDDLAPDAMDWPATTELMVDIRHRLVDGIGIAILDRLPLERWTPGGAKAVVWLLNNFLAPAIMQKWRGARVYDVKDTGQRLAYGVRRSVTNLGQEFHTDGSFLYATPGLMGLACLRPAAEGGLSRAVSLATVHDILRAESPRHLARLYRGFWWDRQKEHAPDARPANWLPVYTWDGTRLEARYYDDYIRNGYRLMDETMDAAGEAALAAMQDVIERPENWVEFRLEAGQVEFVNNHLVAHARTAFRDADRESGRHLLRFWLRAGSSITLEAPAFADA